MKFSKYTGILLGFISGKMYPLSLSDKEHLIEADFAPKLSGNFEIFSVLTDITVPELDGSSTSQTIANCLVPSHSDVDDNPILINTSYFPYVPLAHSYISSISISLVDIFGNALLLSDYRYPIILVLHFRCRQLLIY